MKLNDPNTIGFDGTPVTGRAPAQTVVVGDQALTAPQAGMVSHAYKLFRDALRVSITPYLVQNRTLADGSRVRMESMQDRDIVYVWPTVKPIDYLKARGWVLSGVVAEGEVQTVPPPEGSPPGTLPTYTLAYYRATQNAWEYPLKKDPLKAPPVFYKEPLLANAGDQYAKVASSMYSGLMSKAVQILLGRGVKVPFRSEWACCHGVVYGNDWKPWVVEISADKGVWAMPLSVSEVSPGSAQPVLTESQLVFGGVPDIGKFPLTDEAFNAKRDAGDIIQLISPTDAAAVLGKVPFSPSLGWSFSPDGREAHNTCVGVDGPVYMAYHYKLVFSFNNLPANRMPGAPVGSGSASIVEVESGRYVKKDGENAPFAFAVPYAGGHTMSAPTRTTVADDPPGEANDIRTFPLFVCHIDGELQVLRSVSSRSWRKTVTIPCNPTGGSGIAAQDEYYGFGGTSPVRVSTVKPSVVPEGYTLGDGLYHYKGETQVVGTHHGTYNVMSPTWGALTSVTVSDFYYVNSVDQKSAAITSFFWPVGCRDSYYLYTQPLYHTKGTQVSGAVGFAHRWETYNTVIWVELATGQSTSGHLVTRWATWGAYDVWDAMSPSGQITEASRYGKPPACGANAKSLLVGPATTYTEVFDTSSGFYVLVSPKTIAQQVEEAKDSLLQEVPPIAPVTDVVLDQTLVPAKLHLFPPKGPPVDLSPHIGVLGNSLSNPTTLQPPLVVASMFGSARQLTYSYNPAYFSYRMNIGDLLGDIDTTSQWMTYIGYAS